jgi:hypothetical protein
MDAVANPEVLIRREGRAGRITLNRPQALNATGLGADLEGARGKMTATSAGALCASGLWRSQPQTPGVRARSGRGRLSADRHNRAFMNGIVSGGIGLA